MIPYDEEVLRDCDKPMFRVSRYYREYDRDTREQHVLVSEENVKRSRVKPFASREARAAAIARPILDQGERDAGMRE